MTVSTRPLPPRSAFVLILGMLVSAIAIYGFGHTVDERLIHFKTAPPPILYVHVAVSSAWLALLVVQAALVRSRSVALHRRLGLWGLALGAVVCVVGYITVIVLRRADVASGRGEEAVAFLAIPMLSLLMFAVPFSLAALWRKSSHRHRPLMVLATASLTAAAFVRFPGLNHEIQPFLTDGLMVAAAAWEWRLTRRLNPVYALGIPIVFASQVAAIWLITTAPPAYMAVAHFLLRWT
ncbi:MAG: hypothetical protein JF588_08105 [Caulobacterales bacterium]|nr:hypothetical protein [Caulobacterales bacterium]